MNGNIIAIGGGGFSEGTEPELDTYVLEQTGVSNPAIGFIPTASGDAEGYVRKFYERFEGLDCCPSHLPLFRHTPDLDEWFREQDVLYVGGGNTKSMLAVWEAWGLPTLLREAAEQGTILSGISAGAICWFEQGVTDSYAGELRPIECLGFLSGSCCPHYSLEPERKPSYERMISEGLISPGVGIDDGTAAHFVDGELKRVISFAEGGGVYRVYRSGGRLEVEFLPKVVDTS